MHMPERIVIALGGNALQSKDSAPTAEAQLEVVKRTSEFIAEISQRGYEMAVVHGNGPQVGRIVLASETAKDEDVLDEDQSELLQAAIGFADISAFEVMTARVDVQAIDIDDDWDDILAMIEEAPFSRLPVYEDSIDNIIGVLYLNHFLKAMTDDEYYAILNEIEGMYN